MELKNIGIVGFGLIGGSMGMAIKKYTSHNVYAFDRDEQTLSYVRERNIVDGAFKMEDDFLSECDIIFVALYPKQTIEFILKNKNRFKKKAILCDLCGVKESVVRSVSSESLRFIGAHPMAGKEVSGVYHAEADLFLNSSLILTPTKDTDEDALCEISNLGIKIGFGKIVNTSPKNHDKMIAFTSQLPHIASVAYVLQDHFKKCDGFYAGSFKDMARVAKINPDLWTELFKINGEAITEQIDEYIQVLTQIKNSILSDDQELYSILAKSKELKEWQDENY